MGIEEAIIQEVTENALQEGEKLGIEKGHKEIQIVAIQEMLKDNFSFEQIAKYVQVSIDFVKQVAENKINL